MSEAGDMQEHWDAVCERCFAFQEMLNKTLQGMNDVGCEALIQFVATVRAEGHAQGVKEERARVVAWLRSAPVATSTGQKYCEWAADAIERGEHDR